MKKLSRIISVLTLGLVLLVGAAIGCKNNTATPVYTITFEQENVDPITFKVKKGADFKEEMPELNSKKGYTVSWDKTVDDLKSVTGNITVKAVYTANEYVVIFMNGEEKVGEVSYRYGATEIQAPAVPEVAGKTGRWSDYDLTLADNQTVLAVYESKTFTITFDYGDSGFVGDKTMTVTYDENFTLPENQSEWEFDGVAWIIVGTNQELTEGKYTIDGDITVKFTFTEKHKYFGV